VGDPEFLQNSTVQEATAIKKSTSTHNSPLLILIFSPLYDCNAGDDKQMKLILNFSDSIKSPPYCFHNRAGFLAVTDAHNMGCVFKGLSEFVL